ncbi:LIP-domain-containing protein [Madurella fahalii]|uniref:LIP-domain-containing protein n=1 Tax=Madurella fahalii TaxID=1157608 RepID=A0ABQ0GIB9_9PEZI
MKGSFLAVLTSLLLPTTWAASTLLPPSQDPFYTAPPHLEKHDPGTVLRIRTAPSDTIHNCSAAYHIGYRTTDTRYCPSWAVTTLLLPTSYNPSTVAPLLSYQIPYNSPDIDASPSFDQSAIADPDGPISTALGRGWLVVVADFEGPTASFGAGVQAGHATLDSVRAVLSLSRKKGHNNNLNLGAISRYAMWGYSGGSVATEWATELAVQYAPELAFAGAAIGGVVPNITGPTLDAINKSPYVGDVFAILVGTVNQYPDAYAFLVGSLKEEGPYNRTGFLAVERMTILEAFAFYAGQDVWEYFVQGKQVVEAPIIRKVFQSNSIMGYHGVPQMPLFVYHAVGDKFSPVAKTDALVDRYCGIGAAIRYERNAVGGHLAEVVNGMPRAFAWLVGVLEGTMDLPEGCDIRTVSVNITDIADF